MITQKSSPWFNSGSDYRPQVAQDVIILDGSGLIIGNTTKITADAKSEFQVLGTDGPDSSGIFARFSADAAGPFISFLKTRLGIIGNPTLVEDDDELGAISWDAGDGWDLETQVAKLEVEVDDGDPGPGDIGAAMVFYVAAASVAIREAWRINAAGELLSAGSGFDLDMASAGTILNVGAAGNDWTASKIAIDFDNSGGENQVKIDNQSGDAGSRTLLAMSVGGGSAGDNVIRMGIDGVESFQFGIDNDQSDRFAWGQGTALGTTDRMRLATGTGVLSVDGDGGGSDDPVLLFDKYDDSAELQRFAMSSLDIPEITEEDRQANRERLIEMGVAEWSEQEEGIAPRMMIRVQPMLKLLAGGIYQTRAKLDAAIETIEVMGREIETLKALPEA